MEAMRAAIQQVGSHHAELLRVLEAVAENPEQHARRENHMLHLFALYLLAQFREKRPIRPWSKCSVHPANLV